MNRNIFIKKKSPPPPPPPPRRNSAAAGITWKGEVKMTFTVPARLWCILLCCLFLIGFLAVPVQSQPSRLTNPTGSDIDACGLPTTWAQFNASATVTTFNMSADCTLSDSNVGSGAFLYFAGGLTYTINGNGHSISIPDDTWALYAQTAGTVLNLNNVTISGGNGTGTPVTADNGATLNVRNVTFSGNTSNGPAVIVSAGAGTGGATAGTIENAQFLNNTIQGTADSGTGVLVATGSSSNISITNATFRGNSSLRESIMRASNEGTITGSGIVFDNNQSRTTVHATSTRARITLRDVQFLNNTQATSTETQGRGSAVTVGPEAAVTLTNVVFRGNQNADAHTSVTASVRSRLSPALVTLRDCVTFEGNVQADGATPANLFDAYNREPDDNPLNPQPYDTLIRTGRCGDGGGKSKKKEAAPPTAIPTARPAYGASYVALQTATGMTFEATYGLDSGVHFRQLDGAGIGVQSIIDAGYLAALDVYGYVEQGVEVCFPQLGRVIFLDARTMPRAIVPLESTVRNGMTCVSISSPGSLVLLPN